MEAFVVKSFPSLLIIVLMATCAVTEKLSVESENVMTAGVVADTKLSTENKNGDSGRTLGTENYTTEDYNLNGTGIRRVLLAQHVYNDPDRQCYTQFFVDRKPPVGLVRNHSKNLRYICQPPTQNQQDPQQTYYATMFDEFYGIAVFSAYTLTHEKVKFQSTSNFPTQTWKPTPGINNQGSDEFYLKSGYDKGHLFPGMTASVTLDFYRSTFKYTNAVPQRVGFNRGNWRVSEERIREFGKQCTGPLNGFLYLITGVLFVEIQGDPLFAYAPETELLSDIVIPNSMWTAGMCVSQDGSARSFAVIGYDVEVIGNYGKVKKEMHTQQVTLAKLEAFLEIDVRAYGPKTEEGQVQPCVKLFPGIVDSVNVELPW